MIRSFRSKPLRQFAETGNVRRLPVKQADRIRRVLFLLESAGEPRDLDQPGLMFHGLHGGRFSVRVTANYRITWAWQDNDAVDVDLEDYH